MIISVRQERVSCNSSFQDGFFEFPPTIIDKFATIAFIDIGNKSKHVLFLWSLNAIFSYSYFLMDNWYSLALRATLNTPLFFCLDFSNFSQKVPTKNTMSVVLVASNISSCKRHGAMASWSTTAPRYHVPRV